MLYLVSIVLAAGLLAVVLARRRPRLAAKLACVSVGTVLGLYVIEAGLALLAIEPRQWAAWRHGTTIDRRTKARVVADLREEGLDAQPNVIPSGLVRRDGFAREGEGQSEGEGGRLFPLAGISNTESVFCNEVGSWVVYRSDEHGFRNPAGAHRPGEVDVVLIGDSNVHGQCVPTGEDIAGRLRGRGYRVVNLGMSGNGPLLELASLTEYATPLRPPVVVWTIYEENDGSDLETERQSPTLMRYLEPGFSQGLVARQAEIDARLRSYVEARLAPRLASGRSEEEESRLVAFLRLRRLEARLLVGTGGERRSTESEVLGSLMKRVLSQARRRVEGWGGRLVVLYLPQPRADANRDTVHAEARRLVEGLGLPLVDISPVVAEHPDADSLYPLGRAFSSHFGADGYELVTEALAARLPPPEAQRAP